MNRKKYNVKIKNELQLELTTMAQLFVISKIFCNFIQLYHLRINLKTTYHRNIVYQIDLSGTCCIFQFESYSFPNNIKATFSEVSKIYLPLTKICLITILDTEIFLDVKKYRFNIFFYWLKNKIGYTTREPRIKLIFLDS